jgi:hypothetical protein
MVTQMLNHSALWTAPAPLWGRFATEPGSAVSFLAKDQSAPAILRFANDEFMDQLFSTLAADPRQLGALVARPETWRSPSAEAPDLVERVPLPRIARSLARLRAGKAATTALEATSAEVGALENGIARDMPLKLYQPAHQRHYLVAANLVCGRMGFPDREVATSSAEQVGFVLRRMLPVDSTVEGSPREEYAFVKDASGARWQRLVPDPGASDAASVLASGEELLPLFPQNFQDDTGHPRRLLAGVIPVGRREEYMSTRAQVQTDVGDETVAGIAGNPSAIAARKEQFKMEVAEPWKNIIRSSVFAAARINDKEAGDPPSSDASSKAAMAVNHQAQGQSYLILLDFADYLQLHIRPVWDCVLDPAKQSALTSEAQRRLFNWLKSPNTNLGQANAWPIDRGSRQFASSLCDALLKVRDEAVRNVLERATRSFPDELDDGLLWPDFVYLLAGVRDELGTYAAWGIHSSLGSLNPDVAVLPDDQGAGVPFDLPLLPKILTAQQDADIQAAKLDKLVQLVVQAIDLAAPAMPAPPLPFAVRLRDALQTTKGDPGWFVMRCVYLRCDCGPQRQAVVSAPSQRFQLANFFDPDAPARAIRISLPLDTTPAGMRKHSKNTAFVISDVLCGQIQRAKGLGLGDLVRSVLPWPLHKDLDVGGMGPCKSSPEANIGMICSLSIPIITICALILLMIIVSLLDFIFRWVPWFIMCFPVPGLTAKKGK